MIHGGQLLNGLAGPTIMSAGPFLSTTWFAPDQRATATAVASLFSYLGGAASFLVGPLIVPAPNDSLAAVALSSSSIQSRIQLVMYAGMNRKHGGSIAHHFNTVSGLSRDRNTIRQQGFKNFAQTPKASVVILVTAPLKNSLLRLLCLTDSEN